MKIKSYFNSTILCAVIFGWCGQLQAQTSWSAFNNSGTDPNSPLPPDQTASYASGSNYLKDRDFLAISVSYSF
jgi:hypothetical protein